MAALILQKNVFLHIRLILGFSCKWKDQFSLQPNVMLDFRLILGFSQKGNFSLQPYVMWHEIILTGPNLVFTYVFFRFNIL
jgi:hypothetical protein